MENYELPKHRKGEKRRSYPWFGLENFLVTPPLFFVLLSSVPTTVLVPCGTRVAIDSKVCTNFIVHQMKFVLIKKTRGQKTWSEYCKIIASWQLIVLQDHFTANIALLPTTKNIAFMRELGGKRRCLL